MKKRMVALRNRMLWYDSEVLQVIVEEAHIPSARFCEWPEYSRRAVVEDILDVARNAGRLDAIEAVLNSREGITRE